jgi:hypothetical protein
MFNTLDAAGKAELQEAVDGLLLLFLLGSLLGLGFGCWRAVFANCHRMENHYVPLQFLLSTSEALELTPTGGRALGLV